jgi:hypothetical protein
MSEMSADFKTKSAFGVAGGYGRPLKVWTSHSVRGRCCKLYADSLTEIRHGINRRNMPSIITKENSTKRRESTHQVSLEGDRSFDATHVRRRFEPDNHIGDLWNRSLSDKGMLGKLFKV